MAGEDRVFVVICFHLLFRFGTSQSSIFYRCFPVGAAGVWSPDERPGIMVPRTVNTEMNHLFVEPLRIFPPQKIFRCLENVSSYFVKQTSKHTNVSCHKTSSIGGSKIKIIKVSLKKM